MDSLCIREQCLVALACVIITKLLLSAISDDSAAERFCQISMQNDLPVSRRPNGNFWMIMSAPGAIHTPHFDANGLITWVEIVSGAKLWMVFRPKTRHHPRLPLPNDKALWTLELLKDMSASFIVLEPGDSLCVPRLLKNEKLLIQDYRYMPPNTRHAVATLMKRDGPYEPTVMRGYHAMNRHTMVRTLYGSIDHALFHDVWSNTSHDDRDFSIGHMLAWQESGNPKPFKGDALYALLFLGKNAAYLRSPPHEFIVTFLK